MTDSSKSAGQFLRGGARRLPLWPTLSALAGLVVVIGATASISTASTQLPAAKQVIENRYIQTQATGQQNPAAKDPVGSEPADQPTPLPEGIFEQSDSPFPAADVIIENRWQGTVGGQFYIVYAGAVSATPNQGIVIVVRLGADTAHTTITRYPTPVQVGSVNITSQQGSQVSLLSTTNISYGFDFVAGTFITTPTCALTGVGTNGNNQKYIQITVQGAQAGLQSIAITTLNNATADIPPYQMGIISAPATVATPDHPASPVVVTATKVDQSSSAQVALTVTDTAGGATACDPVLTQLRRGLGAQVFKDVAASEHFVKIQNDQPGLTHVEVIVNHRRFSVDGLRPKETRTLDVAAAMVPGANNTITLIGAGPPNATAQILIWDGSGSSSTTSTAAGGKPQRHAGQLQQRASTSTGQDAALLQWFGGDGARGGRTP